jgi:CheY-like chemotaxis protein
MAAPSHQCARGRLDLKISRVECGAFPEAEGLNPRFRPGAPKLRYVLDTSLNNALVGSVHWPKLDLFRPFFTRLSDQSCWCGRPGADGPIGGVGVFEPPRAIVAMNGRVDLAHYLEHLVLDIQYDLGGAENFIGVTLGFGESANQFMTVVESEETGLGVFAVNTGLAMMHQALYLGTIDPRFHHVLNLTRWLRRSGRPRLSAHQAAAALDIGLAQAQYCLSALRVLEYPVGMSETADYMASHVGPILVAEKDDDGRASLVRSLIELGYNVRCVASGRAAVEILSRYETSVVVLDIDLPDLDGVSIAKWLLESQPATRLVLMSGGIEIPADGDVATSEIRFLPKPFQIAALHHTLQIVSPN